MEWSRLVVGEEGTGGEQRGGEERRGEGRGKRKHERKEKCSNERQRHHFEVYCTLLQL